MKRDQKFAKLLEQFAKSEKHTESDDENQQGLFCFFGYRVFLLLFFFVLFFFFFFSFFSFSISFLKLRWRHRDACLTRQTGEWDQCDGLAASEGEGDHKAHDKGGQKNG
jgi:hypothetical protein